MNIPTFCGKTYFTQTTTILLAGLLLGISPMKSATAQDISWTPLTMTFPDTPINTTATQTLTITNDGAAVPISIDNIEWTWNQPGIISGTPQFAFEADRPIPTMIAPGESMEIDILFTPEEAFTFASANLLVTNTSANAASLNYWIEGMGVEADLCFPLVSCSGICTDLQVDLENCGDCGNVCPIPANGSALCESGTCSFTCNAGYMPLNDECIPIDPCYPFVDCSGECVDLQSDVNNCGGCGNVCPVPANASAVCESADCSFVCNAGYELLDDECVAINLSIVGLTNLLINYWNAAVHEEPITIVGFGPGKSAVHRRDAIEDMLMRAREYVFLGMYDYACGQLRAAYLKTDGGYPFVLPPDFVAGEGVSGLNERIVAVVEGLDGLMSDGCPLPEPTTKSR